MFGVTFYFKYLLAKIITFKSQKSSVKINPFLWMEGNSKEYNIV